MGEQDDISPSAKSDLSFLTTLEPSRAARDNASLGPTFPVRAKYPASNYSLLFLPIPPPPPLNRRLRTLNFPKVSIRIC